MGRTRSKWWWLLLPALGLAWWSLRAEPVRLQEAATRQAELQGARLDGAAAQDGQGALRVDASLRRLFDACLTQYGEQGARRALRDGLQGSLSAAAMQQALSLFDRYLAYKKALGGVQPAGGLAERLEQARAMRLHYLAATEVAGLFGDEDRYDDFTVQRLRIEADASLSAEEKKRRVQELEAALPAELRAARTEPVKHLMLAEAEAALRKQGGGDAAVQALREREVGKEAAERLAALDGQQSAWQQRIDAFKAERLQIQNDAGLSESQKGEKLAQLEASRFDARERLRLPAYVK